MFCGIKFFFNVFVFVKVGFEILVVVMQLVIIIFDCVVVQFFCVLVGFVYEFGFFIEFDDMVLVIGIFQVCFVVFGFD